MEEVFAVASSLASSSEASRTQSDVAYSKKWCARRDSRYLGTDWSVYGRRIPPVRWRR
jgi:hypothetical protein